MGDIADGLINGDFDFHTGEYIGRGYGFPRSRNWRGNGKKKDPNYIYSDKQEMDGVLKWLRLQPGIKNDEDAHYYILKFADEKGIKYGKKKKILKVCSVIQTRFGEFINWYKATKCNTSTR